MENKSKARITPKEKIERYIKKIQREFKTDERKARELYYGLMDALGYWKQCQGIYTSKIGAKEYKRMICALNDSIKKFTIIIKQLPENELSALDAYYYEANGRDDLTAFIKRKNPDEKSGISVIAFNISKTLDIAEKNIRSPGKGHGNIQAKEYISGIEMLARHFQDILPQYKVSEKSDSYFYKYVEMWFRDILKVKEDKLYTRHIRNTIRSPIARTKFNDKG